MMWWGCVSAYSTVLYTADPYSDMCRKKVLHVCECEDIWYRNICAVMKCIWYDMIWYMILMMIHRICSRSIVQYCIVLGIRPRGFLSWISYNITFYILSIECPLYTIYDLLIFLYNITLRVSDYWATFLSPHILPNMSGNSHCDSSHQSYHWVFILRYIQKHLIIQTISFCFAAAHSHTHIRLCQ